MMGVLEEMWMFPRFVGKMQMVKKEMAAGEEVRVEVSVPEMRKSLQGLKTSDPEAKLGVCPEEGAEEGKESVPERERRKETLAPTDATATEHASGQTEF